ncbi:MAG: helix-turn-helix domain-containing protein [Chthoniobacterales bacterium]|nr:helix-turn-helix domain-containing protein [Chthoniobacterales bacterium]
MKNYQRVIHLPPGGRPRWVNQGLRINELQYLSWGWREYGRHAVPVSFHEGWTYQYVAKGRALLDVGERCIPVPRGHLAIIGPSCPNGWQAAGRAERCQIFNWIWRDAPSLPGINPGEEAWRISALSPDEEKQLRALHEETRREITRMDEAASHAIRAIRGRLDVLLARSPSRKKRDGSENTRLEYALNWLRQHPEETRPVTALADYLQVSPATLNRLFQKRMRQNVREFAATLRMESARDLLAAEELSVKEVAFRLGYSHANDFTRAYSRFWGCNPTDSRRKR